MFLFEITDVSDHNSDEPEEDPKCQNYVRILFCCMWARVHAKLTVGLLICTISLLNFPICAHILTFSNRPTISFVYLVKITLPHSATVECF